MKHALLLALVFIPVLTSAQDYATDSGSVLLGGSVDFVTTGDESFLSVDPNALVFVVPGFAVGGALGFSTDFEDTNVSGGPSAAYFFGDRSWKVTPFASLGVRFGEGFDWAVTPSAGGIVFLSPHVGATGQFYYTHIDAGLVDEDLFGLSFGIATFIF